jgi:hypothetical protein
MKGWIMIKSTASVAVLCGILTGCTSPTPAFDARFGESVRNLAVQQTLHPQATLTNRDRIPEGLEGRPARETIERYHRSFESAPQPIQNFMIGNTGGAQGTR